MRADFQRIDESQGAIAINPYQPISGDALAGEAKNDTMLWGKEGSCIASGGSSSQCVCWCR